MRVVVAGDRVGGRVWSPELVPGDAVIVAVPMAGQRALRFSPPVPRAYRSATVAMAGGDEQLIPAPLGRVHFAGEHTAGAWAGLTEGALRSGARAADEVLIHAVA